MIDFQHELSKIQKSLGDKIITEQTASYEITKLRCLAKKLKAEYSLPRQNIIITQNMINEDYKELCRLKNNRLLKDKSFLRDGAKILALCEQYRLEFPGDKDILGKILIDDTARLLSESVESEDEYEGLEDEDEFGDDGTEPRLVAQKTLSDGTVLEQWIINSEMDYGINGEILDRGQLTWIILKNIDDFGGRDKTIEDIQSTISALKTDLNKWINTVPKDADHMRLRNGTIDTLVRSIKELELALNGIKDGVKNDVAYDIILGVVDDIILGVVDIESYFE